jgi:hypothetical protein
MPKNEYKFHQDQMVKFYLVKDKPQIGIIKGCHGDSMASGGYYFYIIEVVNTKNEPSMFPHEDYPFSTLLVIGTAIEAI